MSNLIGTHILSCIAMPANWRIHGFLCIVHAICIIPTMMIDSLASAKEGAIHQNGWNWHSKSTEWHMEPARTIPNSGALLLCALETNDSFNFWNDLHAEMDAKDVVNGGKLLIAASSSERIDSEERARPNEMTALSRPRSKAFSFSAYATKRS